MKRVALAAILALSSCAPAAPTAPPPAREVPVAWADVFEGRPDLVVVVRPRAFASDPVYGAFFGALVRVALARSFGRGASMVEAAEGAQEIVLGLGRGDDAAIVFRGVPASLDPAGMTDAGGRPLFRLLQDRSRVAEYEVVGRTAVDGGLFVLPDRTWVGALGVARVRARRAFATPIGAPAPSVDPEGLAVASVTGPLVHALDRHPLYGPLGVGLKDADVVLLPGKGGLVGTLRYADAPAAAAAAKHARKILAEVAKGPGLAWLAAASVAVVGPAVTVQASLPPRLLEELPATKGSDLDP